MRVRWLRATSALVLIACAGTLWQLVELLNSPANFTPLAWGAAGMAGLVGVAAMLLTFASRGVLQRVDSRIVQQLVSIRAAPLIDNPRAARWLTAGGLAGYAIIVGAMLLHPDDPRDDDQGAFLKTAAEVHSAGGPASLLADLFTGQFEEANRHPLYIALLSLHPTAAFGRALSCMLGLTTLVLLTWMIRLQHGALTSGFLCLLLGTNMAFCRISTVVVCDVLMVLWGGTIFLLATREGARSSWIVDVALGGIAGLAYLTKGTGVLMLGGLILWRTCQCLPGLWFRRRTAAERADSPALEVASLPNRIISDNLRRPCQSLLLIVLAWAAVSLPLLVRNTIRYGTPLYNVNNWLLFVDEFEQPVPLSQRMTVGEAARSYWESHTFADMAWRMTSGLVWESFILLRMLGPFPLDDARILFGVPLALCALAIGLARRRPEHGLLVWWTILFVVMFAWYVPIAAGERFLLPLLAPLLQCAAEGILALISQGQQSGVHSRPS